MRISDWSSDVCSSDLERVAFIWEDERGVHQVAAVNVVTNQWTMLTNSTTDVTNFGIGSSGALVYEAKKQYSLARSEHLSRSGYTITSPDASIGRASCRERVCQSV